MRAVIYARYSSDNQRTESITAQISAINTFALQNKYTIVNTYIDEAVSARSDNRPAFQQMIKDSKTNAFDFIIVHKLDRFSRDRYDSAIYKHKLKENNVRLLSVVERLDDSPESILMESVIEGMSEYYSKNLAREVMKGLNENAKSCRHTGGKPPFGFDIDKEKHYIINEREADAVRMIFSMYAGGHSYKDIEVWLLDNNFKTKYDKPFTNTSLNVLLQNEKYIGTYIYGKTKQTKKNGVRVDVKNAKEDMIIIENGVPQIVEDEIFNLVQIKLKENKANNSRRCGRAKQEYLFTGLLECGHCGGNMTGRSSFSGRNKALHVTYGCSTRYKTKGCKKKDVNKERLEESILEHLEKEVFTDKFIDSFAQKVLQAYEFRKNKTLANVDVLKKQLKDIDSQIDNIVNVVASTGMMSKSFQDKLSKLENDKEHLVGEIEIAKNKDNFGYSIEEITNFLQLGKNLSSKPFEEQKIIVETFIEKIIVTEVEGINQSDVIMGNGDEEN